MKTYEEYHKEVRKNAIERWSRDGNTAFKDMENDPVINLLLSALSFQAFHILRNIEQYEENTIRDLRDRIIPYHLIKAVPAFSIVETQMVKAGEEAVADESCLFEFKKSKFCPLLKTKIINAEIKNLNQQGNSVLFDLQSVSPLEDLCGLSFYIDTDDAIEIESIKCNGQELPVIKPSQYNELPFVKWFNNAHLFQNQNYYLFGTYDYWEELFLTNTTQLFYIGEYDTKKISLGGETTIGMEITLNLSAEIGNKLKINCIPVVNVEKKEAVLNDRNPVQKLLSDTGEFLNLLCDKNNVENVEEYMDSFLVRQYGVERYNPNQLLEQMQEIVFRYASDYYAFQSISELKSGDKLKKMEEIVEEIADIIGKFDSDNIKNNHYAVLKKNKAENKDVYLEYLITSGTSANGIRKDEKALKTPNYLDRNKTIFLLESKGGKNSVKNETQKENIAKYYFQTKDRLITPVDIRTFIKTFYYGENNKLDDEIETIFIKRESTHMEITIRLKNDSPLKNTEKAQSLAEILQTKITLRSTGILPFRVAVL